MKFKTSFLENPWKGGCLFPSEGAGYKGAFMMKGRIDRMSAPFKRYSLPACSGFSEEGKDVMFRA